MKIEFSEFEIRVKKLFSQQVIKSTEIESLLIDSTVHHIRMKGGKEVVLKEDFLQGFFLGEELAEFAAKNHISFVKTADYDEAETYLDSFSSVMSWAEDYKRAFTAGVEPYLKERLGDACSVEMEIAHRSAMVNIFTNIVKDGMKLFPKSDTDLNIYVEKVGDHEDYALDVLDSVLMVQYDSRTNNCQWLVVDDVDAMISMMKKTIDDLCRNGYVYADSKLLRKV